MARCKSCEQHTKTDKDSGLCVHCYCYHAANARLAKALVKARRYVQEYCEELGTMTWDEEAQDVDRGVTVTLMNAESDLEAITAALAAHSGQGGER